MLKLKVIIAGTGRCGTVYTAKNLTSMGLRCGHESIFNWKGIGWAEKKLRGEHQPELSHCSTFAYNPCTESFEPAPGWMDDVTSIEAEASYMAVPFLENELLKGAKIVHLVRNPIKVINSFCNYIDYFSRPEPSNSYEIFIYKHVPELADVAYQYDRAALFYVRWNEMIEQAGPDFFHRIEDNPLRMAEFLGLSGTPLSNTETNTFRKPGVKPFHIGLLKDETVTRELLAMAKRYGYNITSDYLII